MRFLCAGRFIMVKSIRLETSNDLGEFMHMASMSQYDIGVHTSGNQIADAKSIMGLMALDYDEPVLVVTEDKSFLKKIDKWSADE
jgi:hypothetical protein